MKDNNIVCFNCLSKNLKAKKQDYKYVESGLDNVILKDISVYECPDCGDVVPEIPCVERIHELIAKNIINKEGRLTGQEIRFLRKQLGITAVEMANKLSVSKTTLSRWENDKEEVGASNDKLIRLLYSGTSLSTKMEPWFKIVKETFNTITEDIISFQLEKMGHSVVKSFAEVASPKKPIFENILFSYDLDFGQNDALSTMATSKIKDTELDLIAVIEQHILFTKELFDESKSYAPKQTNKLIVIPNTDKDEKHSYVQ